MTIKQKKERIKMLKDFLNSNQPDFDVVFPKAIREIEKLQMEIKNEKNKRY